MNVNEKMKFIGISVLLVFLCLVHIECVSAQENQRMDEMWGNQEDVNADTNTKRTALFDDSNYSMFIHWGIYSNIANKWKDTTYYGISEWIKSPRRAGIPDEEYMAEAKNFNPINFDAKAIAKLAKDAGMKYIIITSKHHDGFAMYNSKSNDFNIVDATPFSRDPMKELEMACEEEGLGFGFYYSHNQDWTYPGGNGGPKTNKEGQNVDFDYYYKNKCLPQVKEITTQYGEIALVWFDTPRDMEKKYVEELVNVVRENQPNALVSGRAGHGLGDYVSLGDMNIPIENEEGLWETVDVTNDSWGFAWYDKNWKSPKRILKSVLTTVARGGTYMLNVGPKPDGSIPLEAQNALRVSGEWIKKYPQVLYKTSASPWGRKLAWGDVTVNEDKINLLVYDWPMDGELFLPGLSNDIKIANLWVNGKKVKVNTSKIGKWTKIELPAKRPEKLISVIELEVEGPIEVDEGLCIDPVFSTPISVAFAQAEHCQIKNIRWMEKFGEWKHIVQAQDWKPESKVIWEVDIMKAGYYQVDLNYSGNGRLVWSIENEENDLVQNQQNSSSVYNYFEMGLMKFESAGRHTISVSMVDGDREKVSLKEIKFTPLESLE